MNRFTVQWTWTHAITIKTVQFLLSENKATAEKKKEKNSTVNAYDLNGGIPESRLCDIPGYV